MATNRLVDLFGSSSAEEIEKLLYLFQCPKEKEKAISFLLEDPRGTLIIILRLCSEICESDWPICLKVSFLSSASDLVKREPKLRQLVDENKIKASDEMIESCRKKIGPHTRGCSMCDPMCFAPPMQYFSTCSMLANRTDFFE